MEKKAKQPWDIGDTTKIADEVKSLAASLLGPTVCAKDVAIVPSCSYAMSLAAHNLKRRMNAAKKAVIVLYEQMHSNVLPWQQLCDDVDGVLRIVERPTPDHDWTSVIERELARGDVAVCAVPPCHWCDGSLIDLKRIGEHARKFGSALVIDATQWLGASGDFDAVAYGCDFVACSVHKWLLGPYGACLCYVSPALLKESMPIEYHDRNRLGANLVECLSMGEFGYPTEFVDSAARLDSGGRPNFILLPMLQASLELVVQLRPSNIERHIAYLVERIHEEASSRGYGVPPSHASHLIGIRPAPWMGTAEDIVQKLKKLKRPVYVAARFGVIRISPYIFNTDKDVVELFQGLDGCVLGKQESGEIL